MRLPDRYDDDVAPVGEDRVALVYRARDRHTGEALAVHVLRPELARWSARFERELHRTAAIVHPAVLPRRDLGRAEGLPFLATAIRAGSFAGYRDRPPSWDELARAVADVLRGLAWIHACGVVHGHLAPEALWLVEGDRHAAQIADLHVGGLLAAVEGRSYPSGRTPYAAPEQRTDAPEAGERGVDLYALGAIVWEAVTGAPPVGSRPAFFPRMVVPAALERLLSNLLQPNPYNRYDLAADVLNELAALDSASPSREGTVGAPYVAGAGRPDETFHDTTARGLTADEVLSIAVWNRPLPAPLAAGAPPAPVDESPGGAAVRVARDWPLVGRAPERELLWAAARRAHAEGAPHVALVSGPEGVGRARLVRHLVRALEASGWAESAWCTYRAGVADGGMAGSVRALVRPDAGDRAATVARVRKRLLRERSAHWRQLSTDAEALGAWFGPPRPREVPPPADLGPDELVRHLQARAWRGLAVLVLHEVHAAVAEDPLGWVERWMDRRALGPGPFPLLVVATTTDEALEASAPFAARWRALGDRGGHVVPVPALTTDAVGALIRSLGPFDDATCARVAAAAEGRPARAIERLRSCAEQGLIDDAGPEWSLTGEPSADPTSRWSSEAYARRLTDAAHLIALSGGAPLPLVQEWAGAEGDQLLAGPPFTVEDGWVAIERRSDEVALLRAAGSRPDAAYLRRRIAVRWAAGHAHLDHGLRAVVHGLAAGAVEVASGALLSLSDRAEATECGPITLRAAALAAMLRGAGRDPFATAVAALCRARAAEVEGKHAQAAEAYEGARVAFADHPERKVWAALGAAWSHLRGEEVAHAKVSLESLAGQGEAAAVAAQALIGLALIEERERAADLALATWKTAAERAGRGTRLAARAVAGRGELLRRLGRFDEAEDLFQAAAGAFRDTMDPLGELRAELGLWNSVRQRRPDEEVERRLIDAVDRALCLAPAADWSAAWLDLADLARHRGAPDEARARYDRAAEGIERLSAPERVERLELGRAQLALAEGDLDASYEHTRRAGQALERLPGHHRWSVYRAVVASLLAARHEHTETSQWLWSAQEVGVREWVDRDTALALAAVCDVAAERGWGNVLRLAGQLGVEQLERLSESERAARLQQRVAGALI